MIKLINRQIYLESYYTGTGATGTKAKNKCK
jgi:hypothetical protein